MDCLDLPGFRGKPQRLGRNLEKLRGVAQVEPWLYPVLGGLEHRDAIVRPHRCHTLAGPSVAIAGLQAIAVEDAGDHVVIGDEYELAHGGDRIRGRSVPFTAASPPRRGAARGARPPGPRRWSASFSAAVAAAIAPGPTTASNAFSMASSTRRPPKAMQ